MAWRGMGFALAFRKGQLGVNVSWVGHDISVDPKTKTVTAAIKK